MCFVRFTLHLTTPPKHSHAPPPLPHPQVAPPLTRLESTHSALSSFETLVAQPTPGRTSPGTTQPHILAGPENRNVGDNNETETTIEQDSQSQGRVVLFPDSTKQKQLRTIDAANLPLHMHRATPTPPSYIIDAALHDSQLLSEIIVTALSNVGPRGAIEFRNVPSPYSVLHKEPLLSVSLPYQEYDSNSHTLRVAPMAPTPMHDAVGTWASQLLLRASSRILTESEAEMLSSAATRAKLPQGTNNRNDDYHPTTDSEGYMDAPQQQQSTSLNTHLKRKPSQIQPCKRNKNKQKKTAADIKTPDMAFRVGTDTFPAVVFESGFTETWDDLVRDAKQWIENSRGRVRLVVLVKIQEGLKESSGSTHVQKLKADAIAEARRKCNSKHAPPRSPGTSSSTKESDDDYEDCEGEIDSNAADANNSSKNPNTLCDDDAHVDFHMPTTNSDDDCAGTRSPLSSPPEYPSDIELFKSTIPWKLYLAPPITACVQLWRYDPTKQTACPAIDVYEIFREPTSAETTDSSIQECPSILVSRDLFGRDGDQSQHDLRRIELSPELFREHMIEGLKKYAYERRLRITNAVKMALSIPDCNR